MRLFLTTSLLLLSTVALAEVVDQAPGGFTSRSVHVVAASPDQVWAGMTNDIGLWWHPDHTWSGDAANLFLDGQAGEEFGEKLPGGGTVTHMEVVYADKGKLLRLRGSLGPLQAMAVVGILSIEMANLEIGTQLTVTYAVGGYGVEGLSGPVDSVIVEQFERLVGHLTP